MNVNYVIRNESTSDGTFFLEGSWHILKPGQVTQVPLIPSDISANLTVKRLVNGKVGLSQPVQSSVEINKTNEEVSEETKEKK